MGGLIHSIVIDAIRRDGGLAPEFARCLPVWPIPEPERTAEEQIADWHYVQQEIVDDDRRHELARESEL